MMSRGQMFPVIALALFTLLVLGGLVLDGGALWVSYSWAQETIDAQTCGVAAGADVSPTEATFVIGDGDVRGTLTGTSPTYFLQLVGFSKFDYTVVARCLRPQVKAVPVAVKELWLDGVEHPILGAEHPGEQQCDDCVGAEFAGAVIDLVRCGDANCDPRSFYSPAEETNSPNTLKDLYRDRIMGSVGAMLPEIGERVPQVDGVSNKFLVGAFRDAGYEAGDRILVLVFSGQVVQPAPSYGNWENLEILYFAVMEITEITTNTLSATFIERVNDPAAVTRVQAIPWNWSQP